VAEQFAASGADSHDRTCVRERLRHDHLAVVDGVLQGRSNCVKHAVKTAGDYGARASGSVCRPLAWRISGALSVAEDGRDVRNGHGLA
jgi:hypothetical protein